MIDDRELARRLDALPQTFGTTASSRLAAVLVPILEVDGFDHLVLTRRRDDLPSHPGQISFPGGAREGGESPLECALRESAEEIALEPELVAPLGSLPPRGSIGGFHVEVVVARVATSARLHPDPGEVAELLLWPMHELLDPARWIRGPMPGHPGRGPVWQFLRDDRVLWGLTARFVLDLAARVRGEAIG